MNRYDLVLLDINVPESDMPGLMKYIHVRYPETKVLIFSMNAEHIYAKRFLKAGAMGFLSKAASPAEIKKAFDLVLNNRKYISASLAESLVDDSFPGSASAPFEKLSSREFEIASLLLSGQTTAEISRSLNIEPSTVGTHKARIFEKLGVTNILELKELANQSDL